ncbi:hypothetical protein [Aggregatilinea lenta]|uniref:hypothetical protein n=1 Tax=Aggregatilinea lenta TaxID=913108 RepID=UPI000E5A20E9|nr:hypothetical protein [Aggregatilinea lenta]
MAEFTPPPFDPDFDDREWNTAWLDLPVTPIPPGRHSSGYSVEQHTVDAITIFDRPYRLTDPVDLRLLFDPQGRLWMSDTPQERIMMVNNASRTRGHVLIGGLGLGLYPQYAAAGVVGEATRFTVIEQSAVVREIVGPTVSAALDVPLDIVLGDVVETLTGPVTTRYDTIFLDTWDTLDAANLPRINALRDAAVGHLAPGGRVLLWGYGWMLELFEAACQRLLARSPEQRRTWLLAQADASPGGVDLLLPVAEHFEGQVIDDMDAALDACRAYAVTVTE